MAGKMVFDRAANPNARIDNRGTITVKQAGLAALVAPSVANSGVINAKLGQVVLAGAAAHTLDMYGDGLVSIDVTKQVVQAPSGPDGKAVTALVTNSGTIRADGGVVQLTASAADGVVQTLVRAGGKVQANTAGGKTGRIEITGTGGSVVVEGRIAADGRAPGSVGGQVVALGSDATTLAATAHVTASGKAGGGVVAIGTTLARAKGSTSPKPLTSAQTTIAAGARVSADATVAGNGGRVTVLSTQSTTMAGSVTARGGKTGGNGGTVELSGGSGFVLTGTADTSAPHGALGTILLDPTDLTIVPNSGTTTATVAGTAPQVTFASAPATATITEAAVEGLTGNIDLQASNNLMVTAPLNLGAKTLTLQAGNTLTVTAASAITALTVTLSAADAASPAPNLAGAMLVQGSVTGTRGVTLDAGTGGITVSGSVATGSGALTIGTTGLLTDLGTGQVTTGTLEGTAASVSLTSRSNLVSGIATGATAFTVTGTAGDFHLGDRQPDTHDRRQPVGRRRPLGADGPHHHPGGRCARHRTNLDRRRHCCPGRHPRAHAVHDDERDPAHRRSNHPGQHAGGEHDGARLHHHRHVATRGCGR